MDASVANGKVLTETPLLDEIVYNCKIMVKGCVLKDEEEALNNESLESITNGDAYVALCEGKGSFSMFVYDEDILRKIPSLTEEQIIEYATDNDLIPQELRPILFKYASEDFINNYEELNNYYRRLHGLPDYGSGGLFIDKDSISIDNLNPYIVNYLSKKLGDNMVPIHELSVAEIEILETNGVLDRLRSQYPEYKYLNFLGFKSISFYDARHAPKFGLLYVPTPDSTEVLKRFKELIERNRIIFINTIYTEAYRFESDYYDKFIIIMIIIQTFVDMVVELPEYIIRRDIFDLRTAQYIFESNGVEYFPDIPLRYQIALVRNLNKLIKFKSTDKNIIDICSLFGFDNIQVFRYYIFKDRKVTSQTIEKMEYLYNTKDDVDEEGNVTKVDDNDENYDIRFIKVPIDDVFDNYIRDNINIFDYDSIVESDSYWTGDRTRDDVLSTIKNSDFTIAKSKYISLEALFDLTELTFQMTYFMNILFHNDIDKSLLQVKIPSINNTSTFNIVDIFILLYALGYEYNGVEDRIMDTQGKILSILGFNFEADLQVLGEYIIEKGYKVEDFGIENFYIPTDGIFTFNQLMDIYTTNRDIYKHVIEELTHPEKKEIYDIYKKIYESLMIMRLNLDYYKLPNGEQAETFTDFLKYKDPILYSYLLNVKAEVNVEYKKQNISNIITNITTYLEDYLDMDILEYIFSNLPSVSIDFIKNYIAHVINFFKSFKIHLLNISTVYRFEDKFENTVVIIDWLLLKYVFEKAEQIHIDDKINNNLITTQPSETINMIDKLWLDISRWVERHYNDEKYDIRDTYELIAKFWKYDFTNIADSIMDFHVSMQKNEFILINEIANLQIYLEKDEFIRVIDMFLSLLISMEKRDDMNIVDEIQKTSRIAPSELVTTIRERIMSCYLTMQYSDSIKITDTCHLIITTE